jgi:hypothetical protein
MRALLILVAIVLALGGSVPADASHATACNALPTSGTRVENQSCNPRQECQNAAGNNQPARAACNALPTSGQCPHTVNFNPRADCIAKLPAPPTVSVSSITGGAGGGNNTWPQTDDFMFIHGQNVGLPGGSVGAQESGFTVEYASPSGSCTPPDCVRVLVKVGNASPGTGALTRHIKVTAPGGHSNATGTFYIVAAPPPQQTTYATGGTSTGGGGTFRSGVISGTSTQSRNVALQFGTCSPSVILEGQSATCQLLAKVEGPALTSALTGSVAENMPGVHYLNISPSSFTIPTSAGSSMLAVGTITLTNAGFNDPNQSPGTRAPGTQGYRTTAPFKASVVWPQSSSSGTSTAEAVSGIIVESR